MFPFSSCLRWLRLWRDSMWKSHDAILYRQIGTKPSRKLRNYKRYQILPRNSLDIRQKTKWETWSQTKLSSQHDTSSSTNTKASFSQRPQQKRIVSCLDMFVMSCPASVDFSFESQKLQSTRNHIRPKIELFSPTLKNINQHLKIVVFHFHKTKICRNFHKLIRTWMHGRKNVEMQ